MQKYIKLITGYRQDQYYTIDAEEAHKAYYLFLNPEMRGVFNNGVALIGKNITGIEPDYNATMGYNPTHFLDHDDWNEIRSKQVDTDLKYTLESAQMIAKRNPDLVAIPLSEAKEKLGLKDAPKRIGTGPIQLGDYLNNN